MFPPGRVLFLRPIKILTRQEKKNEQGVTQQWDAIWITPQELIQEGILVSKKVVLCPALVGSFAMLKLAWCDCYS